MIKLDRKQQVIIISLLILFFLGRVMGLHAHGHVEINHTHDNESHYSEYLHEHIDKKTHLVSHMNDSNDLMADKHEGIDTTFEIDHAAIIKKQNNSFDLTQLLFLALIVIAWLGFRPSVSNRFSNQFSVPLVSKPCLALPPLRAPPAKA